MCLSLLRRGALLAMALAGLAYAQQTFPFQLLVTASTTSGIVQNGSTLTFSTAVGQSDSANILAIYRGTGRASITQPPQILGSNNFDVSFLRKLPLDLGPGDSFAFDVFYRPSNTSQSTAQLILGFVETIPANPNNPSQPTVIPGSISLVLQGTVPVFTFSYSLQSDQNVVPLQPGDSIVFPATLINTTAQAVLNITNRGSGPGVVKNITITGSAFRLVGLPLLPITVAGGQNLQIGLTYKPSAVGSDTGQIQITTGVNTITTIGLQGTGTSSTFLYEVLQDGSVTPVQPGGSVPIADTNIGDTSSVAIRVRNSGNANGVINSITLIGPGFQLSGVPIMLPITLTPNNSLTFNVNFTPTQAGTFTAHVSIGGDSFDLVGRGLGPKLVFSYVSGGSTVTLGANGSVFFSPTTISQTTSVDFVVKNTGTQAATISSIGIGEARSPFAVSGLPPLPLTLDPDAQTRFSINFAPTAAGFTTGTLRIDNNVIGLTGSANAPPALPTYTFQGPTGSVDPLSQPTVRLKLDNPYPLAIAGTLTLTVSGDLPSDPAVQFLTGGRTVSFVIPANGTDAVFANQGPQIRLQSGTVASTITLTPSFATQTGAIDLTPSSPPVLQFSVASGPPVLIAVQPSNETANSFVLNVSGYTTTRSLTTLNVQFTAAQGFTVTTTQFTIDLRQVATLFFQSSTSQAFGGQFSIAMPFTFQGTVGTGQTALSSVTAVAVTVSNDRGTSNSLQAKP